MLLQLPANEKKKQTTAPETASGQRSDSRKRAIANDRAAPSDEQGNAHAHGGSGHGQQTETAHVESGHGVTGTGPRTGTGHAATESFHVESDSGQKTATALAVSDHETSVTRTKTARPALDLLPANGKRSESERDGDVHESYPLET